MKKAIQFGAGNIGRGFIGAVLEQAGYHVVFADVNEQVVARINSDRAYTVQIMDTVCEQMRITDISAMDSRSPELAAQIAGAELVTTAVGLTVLPASPGHRGGYRRTQGCRRHRAAQCHRLRKRRPRHHTAPGGCPQAPRRGPA